MKFTGLLFVVVDSHCELFSAKARGGVASAEWQCDAISSTGGNASLTTFIRFKVNECVSIAVLGR